MNEFLSFRKMITPIVIQVLFWLGVAVCVIGAIVQIGQKMVLQGLLLLIVGPFIVRIYCELLIVVFKILEGISEIAANTRQAPPSNTQAPTQ